MSSESWRNRLDLYQLGIRPLLFSGLKLDPEWLHQQSLQLLERLSDSPPQATGYQTGYKQWLKQRLETTLAFQHPALEQRLWGQSFPNPLGLAAGFDKDGVAAGLWHQFGFGFSELGTVTLHPQPGNPRPRLFRLVDDRAVLNRMGFNNSGAEALANRLQQINTQSTHPIPIGVNLGKSKVTPLEDAPADYLGSFQWLKPWGDYFVVNVSSPNTPGLRSLQSSEQLERILQGLQQDNDDRKPILVKIAPDLEWQAIADVLELADRYRLAGVIATNTTIRRDGLTTQTIAATGKPVTEEAGGISGAPLRQRSTEVIRFIYNETQGSLPIIGVGGIFTAEDAWEKIAAGATLIQTYTGWIYEGPWMVRRILEGLVQRLSDRGMTHISEAIGLERLSKS